MYRWMEILTIKVLAIMNDREIGELTDLNSFCHHFITFSYSQIEKINRDENIVFVILDGKPIDYAKNNLTPPIASKILSQITLI